ncbi:hypothetical protein DdX_17264 [Ditylenchus destructor]|uniref:Uncharacterized protein n=1 Tax=Ditylenchus destructor TaxID=166010 RepID=A0AAD4MN26_9BILA|nr:hypothetical protein DdX_17264 [Ditylenchus destructor]
MVVEGGQEWWTVRATGHITCGGSPKPDVVVEAWYEEPGKVEKFGQARTNGTGYFFLFDGHGVDPTRGHADHVELRIENNCGL